MTVNLGNYTPDILKDLSFEDEDIHIGLNGKVSLSEVLSRFKDNTTENVMKILKDRGETFYLFEKVLRNSYYNKDNKERKAVNGFLKDLNNPNILELILLYEFEFKATKPKIVIEIVEEDYGELNEVTFKNIKALKQIGVQFSVDDFTLVKSKNNISLEILKSLLENDITPEFVKIDGPFMQQLIYNKVDNKTIELFRELAKKLKSLGITIIGERIQSEEEGRRAKYLGVDLFQGKNLSKNFHLGIPIIENNQAVIKLDLDRKVYKFLNTLKEEVEQENNTKDNMVS